MKKIGKYKYSERHCLGQGSFGKVFEGTDEGNRRVAIKKVEQRILASEPYLKESLQTQIAIMKRLKHRNIAQLIDTVITTNSIYLIIEFCSGGDLKSYSRQKKHTEEGARDIITQIVSGFEVIVSEGITHRDLKPANILVHEGVFKICDFGFAKYFGDGGKMAKTCVGTPIYMSPQVLKQKKYSNKTDIWSLGVVYYELLFGKLPYVGKSEDEIFRQINKGSLHIPKCTQFSYLFLKNTLAIEECDRWSWEQVFKHFDMDAKREKPNIYQNITNNLVNNFFNPFSNESKEPKKYEAKDNKEFSREARQIENIRISDNNRTYDQKKNDSYRKINWNYQSSPENQDKDHSPKPKVPVKMAKNIFAANEISADNNLPPVSNGMIKKPSYNEARNDRSDSPTQKKEIQEHESIRKLYWITVELVLNPKKSIPSYNQFIFSLFHFTLGLYHKEIEKYKSKGWSENARKMVLIQERSTLEKLQVPPQKYTDPRQMVTIIELQGKTVLNLEQIGWLKCIQYAKD